MSEVDARRSCAQSVKLSQLLVYDLVSSLLIKKVNTSLLMEGFKSESALRMDSFKVVGSIPSHPIP